MNKTVSEQQKRVSIFKQIFTPTKKKLIVLTIFCGIALFFWILQFVCLDESATPEGRIIDNVITEKCGGIGFLSIVISYLMTYIPVLLTFKVLTTVRVNSQSLFILLLIISFMTIYYVVSCVILYLWMVFLKRTKNKTIVLILLFFLISITPIVNAVTDSNQSNNQLSVSVNVSSTETMQNILFVFVQIIYYYVISCLLIAFYKAIMSKEVLNEH